MSTSTFTSRRSLWQPVLGRAAVRRHPWDSQVGQSTKRARHGLHGHQLGDGALVVGDRHGLAGAFDVSQEGVEPGWPHRGQRTEGRSSRMVDDAAAQARIRRDRASRQDTSRKMFGVPRPRLPVSRRRCAVASERAGRLGLIPTATPEGGTTTEAKVVDLHPYWGKRQFHVFEIPRRTPRFVVNRAEWGHRGLP